MVGLNPGRLRDSVSFIRLIRESDGGGGYTATEEAAFETKGDVQPLKSVRALTDLKLSMVQPYQLTIRRNPQKLPKVDMIVVWRNSRYLINEIQDVDKYKRWIHLVITRE